MNEMNNNLDPQTNELDDLSTWDALLKPHNEEALPEPEPQPETPSPRREAAGSMPPATRRRKPKNIHRRRAISRFLLRFAMVLMTVILLVFCAAWTLLDTVFNGPSTAARDVLVRSLSYSSGTWWIPSMFLGEELANQIITDDPALELENNSSGSIEIDSSGALNSSSDEWKDYPDGIRIEEYQGASFTAHIMIIRDPSTVYLGVSSKNFSPSVPGGRLNQVMEQYKDTVIAGINAGAFNDPGGSSIAIGATPCGLVVSEGEIIWKDTSAYNSMGFVGFNEDNVMIVSKSINSTQAKEWKIRDGVCFGPVLIMDGEINQQAYDNDAGWNPRTAIGQRADGAVIMICIDGRQVNGVGGSYGDLIDIMVEYGAVNACNLDGGSSSIMYYRDTYGRYEEPGSLVMVNNYSLLQEEPRRMPTFFLVRKSEG